jgi:hypothetical protein
MVATYIDHLKLSGDCQKLETEYIGLRQIKSSPAFTDSMFTEEQHERYSSLATVFEIVEKVNSWRIEHGRSLLYKEKNRRIWFPDFNTQKSPPTALKLCELVAYHLIGLTEMKKNFNYQLPVGANQYIPAIARHLKNLGIVDADSNYGHYTIGE